MAVAHVISCAFKTTSIELERISLTGVYKGSLPSQQPPDCKKQFFHVQLSICELTFLQIWLQIVVQL
ncbi:MAG: hypothetical protein ACI9QV_000313 [Methylophagaceae bacterium]|jgi:hypothetical protein